LALLKAGTTDGLSIGFRTVRGRIDPKTRIRKLYQIDLWEISIVTFPLLPGARVRAVKEAGLPSQPLLHARTRHSWPVKSWPVDPSTRMFRPERLFRRQPRLSFPRARNLADQ